ncbi:hypothetical protein [Paenibacillus anseongense]|uniref:hypothetical protein n=1 Tax=Paenibacillus anseongense TaxID=2682845 RepID=UPI002DBE7D89|nr:hypothetical protein [Paenibacillus anseongense]MEC0269732.1 hypothetical protein [Paenibacillus anseongense]
MRITCFYDDYFDMGYIYLRQAEAKFDTYTSSKNEIGKLLNPEELKIPYITEDVSVPFFLDQMKIPQQTFRSDYEKNYETEYGNDFDQEGYITGIELGLEKERFIELIQKKDLKFS